MSIRTFAVRLEGVRRASMPTQAKGAAMKHLVLLYDNPSANMPPAKRQALLQAYGDFTESVRASGHFVSGDPVIPVPDQTRTVNAEGVRNGPAFAIPEALVGVYVLDCTSIDEAAKLAAKIPAAKTGNVQVVPIMEM